MADSSRSQGRLAALGRPQTPPPWSITDVLSTFIVLALAVLLLGPSITTAAFNGVLSPVTLLFGWLIGLMVVTAFVVFTRQRQWDALRLNAGDSRWPLPYALLVGVAAALTIDVLVGLLAGFRPVAPLNGIGAAGGIEWLIAALFAVLVQPLAEGLVFQGVTLPRLRATLGAWPGFWTTTLLQAAFYYIVYAATLPPDAALAYGVIVPLAAAGVLNAVRILTESTRAVIVAQMGMGITFLLAAVVLAS